MEFRQVPRAVSARTAQFIDGKIESALQRLLQHPAVQGDPQLSSDVRQILDDVKKVERVFWDDRLERGLQNDRH